MRRSDDANKHKTNKLVEREGSLEQELRPNTGEDNNGSTEELINRRRDIEKTNSSKSSAK